MVAQKELNLNQPLDANVDPKLRRIPLDPSLATLALTLHGDYYSQLQGKCNKRIVWDPLVQLTLLSIFVAFNAYMFHNFYDISDSVGEFFQLVWRNKVVLTNYFPVLIVVGTVVGVTTFYISDEFRTMSDSLASDSYMANMFQFPLRIYANASEDDLKTPLVENSSKTTDLIEYRNSPIAVVTVVPDTERSTEQTFYAKITGLHVRKSYANAGLEFELLQFAKEKAIQLCQTYAKDKKLNVEDLRVVLTAEGYSVDPVLPQLYLQSGFKVLGSSYVLDPYKKGDSSEMMFKVIPMSRVYKLFSIQRLLYELEL
ncbi:hypothetical protein METBISCDRAFT_27441 [Metschnikowia bicuspidata]|uniref:N-acetyltransferase domain-containing protein n=1 Tax=Metschnikowia bicuspidata TaxID=27322 RepID=A0A4V1J303_9ASCO|nr:hypothetical protein METBISCDRAFT_27441 [Metschnikowia bicuspidata]